MTFTGLIAICLAMMSCKTPASAPTEDQAGSVIEVEAEGIRGVIFPAEAAGSDIGWSEMDRWTPSVEEALEAEAIVRECTSKEAPEVHERYDDYTRQYVGYIHDDRKMIFINYFVQRPGFDYWKERLVRVKDGGTNFFEVRVDLASATCEQLYVHGEA